MKVLYIVSLVLSIVGIIAQLLLMKYYPNHTERPLAFVVSVVWFFLSCIGIYSRTGTNEEEFQEYIKRNSNKNKYHE